MNSNFVLGLLFGLVSSTMYYFTNLNFTIATVAFVSILLGLYFRSNRQKHIPLMLLAISLDIGLVLFLQLTRSAIQKTVSGEPSAFQYVHIGSSTLAVLFYFPVLYYGFKTLKDIRFKNTHSKFARIAFICRMIGFIFMFSQLK